VLRGPSGADDIRGFTWWGGAAGYVTYDVPNNTSSTDVMTGGGCGNQPSSPPFPCTTTSSGTYLRMQMVRSKHTGGVNVAMCDGSVRFAANSVSLATWRALGTAQGQEVLASDW
jgi:prepilin-type processing-associated H-X9-DG protein